MTPAEAKTLRRLIDAWAAASAAAGDLDVRYSSSQKQLEAIERRAKLTRKLLDDFIDALTAVAARAP